jgi:UDP-N-acetylmuramate--alanine ligase
MTHYHFIGIGGIGMSGLATILLEKGNVTVSGSDLNKKGLSEKLSSLGATVFQGHAVANLPENAIVIVSSEIPPHNPELQEAVRRGCPILHRSDLLVKLMKGYEPLVVTGTHGKTTVTSLLAHVFFEAKEDPSFSVGGVVPNFGTNARYGSGRFFIAEADESDGTFLKYPYRGAIVTNIDSDHLAHHGTMERLEQQFAEFFQRSTSPSTCFFCGDDQRLQRLHPEGTSYGFSPTNTLSIHNFRASEEGITYDIEFSGKKYLDIKIPLFGRHNALNSSAVFGLGIALNLPEEAIRSAFKTFRGVKRRLDKKAAGSFCTIFDDYGHHPTEISETIKALRSFIGKKRLVVVFQPHRPSRMKYTIHELPGAFQQADMVIVTDLYLSNEGDSKEVNSQMIFEKVKNSHDVPTYFCGREGLVKDVFSKLLKDDVVIFFGAGDITKAADDLADMVRKGK